MDYNQARNLKEEITNHYVFSGGSSNTKYLYHREDYSSVDLVQYEFYEKVNGVAIIKKDKSYLLKFYTEGYISIDKLAKYFDISAEQILIDEIGPIKILGLPQIGDSIGHYKVSAGTLGCYVKNGYGKICVLSNNHVLANFNKGKIGDAILSPGKKDGGINPTHCFATLANFIKVNFGNSTNIIDCAVAELLKQEIIRGEMPENILVNGTTQPYDQMIVKKTGRTTKLTQGTIQSLDASIKVDYGGIFAFRNLATFDQQIEIKGNVINQRFSSVGDSGALLIDNETNMAVGLIFAGAPDGTTFANPINTVLSSLSIAII